MRLAQSTLGLQQGGASCGRESDAVGRHCHEDIVAVTKYQLQDCVHHSFYA